MSIVKLFLFALAASSLMAMPPAEQNALVKSYCAVCHSDAAKNGGLSLEHYDAARRDPGLAAMLLSKLNNGAMGAAGIATPAPAVREAWMAAARAQAVGATEWLVERQGETWSAGIVREVAPRKAGSQDVPLYRLTLACNGQTGVGEMQLSWSPEPQTGRTFTLVVDKQPAVERRVEGKEAMGNGTGGQTGRAALVLTGVALPQRQLVVRELFPGETVVFPFSAWTAAARAGLGACFRQAE